MSGPAPASSSSGKAPRVVAFACECAGPVQGHDGDAASGSSRVLRIPCATPLNPAFVLRAFEGGADGVLVVACEPEGPAETPAREDSGCGERTIGVARRLVRGIGIDSTRMRFEAAADLDHGIGPVIRSFEDELREIGPGTFIRRRSPASGGAGNDSLGVAGPCAPPRR